MLSSFLNSVPKELKGSPKLETLVIENTENGELRELEVQGVFVAYGHIAQNAAFDKLTELR